MTKSESADGSAVLTTVPTTSAPVPISVGVVNVVQPASLQLNSPLPVSDRVVGSKTPGTRGTVPPELVKPKLPNIKIKTGPLKSEGLVDPTPNPVVLGIPPAQIPVYPVGFNGVVILMSL